MSTPSIAEVLAAAGATLFERGWLSANNLLICGDGHTVLIDSGYHSHADQTLALVEHALGDRALDLLINTHLHSDHCGGNAALQARYPHMRTGIPPGQAEAVARWDEEALTYRPTGQHCPRFVFTERLTPGDEVRMGSLRWQIHGAKGHDPHSIILFQPELRLLVSADALWQNGFGVVFPELEGVAAFDEVADTLDLIEQLKPITVIPGHGAAFQDVDAALARARSRLDQFRASDGKHRRYAMKVLIKFRLLEWQQIDWDDLKTWALSTPYLAQVMPANVQAADTWLNELLNELQAAQALERTGSTILNR